MKTEFLAKAEENLTAAHICFENGLYNACANRAYYAALHAAVAALAHRGIRRDKISHGQVQADFSGELIKRRKVYPGQPGTERRHPMPPLQTFKKKRLTFQKKSGIFNQSDKE